MWELVQLGELRGLALGGDGSSPSLPLIKEYSVIGSTTASKTVSMGSSPITLANYYLYIITL